MLMRAHHDCKTTFANGIYPWDHPYRGPIKALRPPLVTATQLIFKLLDDGKARTFPEVFDSLCDMYSQSHLEITLARMAKAGLIPRTMRTPSGKQRGKSVPQYSVWGANAEVSGSSTRPPC